jgi:hypothetical protein
MGHPESPSELFLMILEHKENLIVNDSPLSTISCGDWGKKYLVVIGERKVPAVMPA